MNITQWLARRGPKFISRRAILLLNRYGVIPSKAIRRILRCMQTLAEYEVQPTFFVPGRLVQHYPQFMRQLQGAAAEIGVHSYNHVALNACPVDEARNQLVRAAQAFEESGIEVHGFRCPYLGCSDELLEALPSGVFEYSSNKALRWDGLAAAYGNSPSPVYDTINRFYQPASCEMTLSVPFAKSGLVEIPVCVPDDLQLHDGLHLGSQEIARIWIQTLAQTHRVGELFTLMFHPELSTSLEGSFVAVLREARQCTPSVWIARLRDIHEWWREKSSFKVEIADTSASLRVSFSCSERATILARGIPPNGSMRPWDGRYDQLHTKVIDVPSGLRPFIGLAPDVPASIRAFLKEQGYILDTSETATRCGTHITGDLVSRLTSQRQLVDYIEASTSLLVRYWRWPSGAKSALSVTGDLDALTILDYAARPFVR